MKATIALLALVVGLAMTAGASAGHSIHVSGTYAVTDFGAVDCSPVPAGFIFDCRTTGFVSQYSGDLTGTSVTDFTQQINCATGRTHGTGAETLTGSVAGVGSGTLTWRDVFDADFDCATFTASNFHGSGVDVKGSGGLAGMRGGLAFTDTTYDGTLR
jgi:hypothetical protein